MEGASRFIINFKDYGPNYIVCVETWLDWSAKILSISFMLCLPYTADKQTGSKKLFITTCHHFSHTGGLR